MKERFKTNKRVNLKSVFYLSMGAISFLCTIKLITNQSTHEYFLSSFISENTRNESTLLSKVKSS